MMRLVETLTVQFLWSKVYTIRKYLNSNLENLIVYLILDYPISSNSRQEDENNILLNNFFQSATAIVNGQIKDAIVMALAQGIL